MLGSLILYLKGMRIVMFQLSGFYYRALGHYIFSLIGLKRSLCTFFKTFKSPT